MDDACAKKDNANSIKTGKVKCATQKRNSVSQISKSSKTMKSGVAKNSKTRPASDETNTGCNMLSCLGSLSSMSSQKEQVYQVKSPARPGSGSAVTRVGEQSGDNMVRLNVYGLTSLNQTIRYTGLGIYHSGVQVYGVEWAYGGYPYPVSSIFRMRQPRDLASLSDINGRFHFVESIEMGRTKFTYDQVKAILTTMGQKEWIGTNYHLLYRNCNCFSEELCKTLCNKQIPSWVNRLAWISSKFPFLVKLIPDEYFTPVALQNKLKQEQELKFKLSKTVAEMSQKQMALEKSCIVQTKTMQSNTEIVTFTKSIDQNQLEIAEKESTNKMTAVRNSTVERFERFEDRQPSEFEKSTLSVKSLPSAVMEMVQIKMTDGSVQIKQEKEQQEVSPKEGSEEDPEERKAKSTGQTLD